MDDVYNNNGTLFHYKVFISKIQQALTGSLLENTESNR